MLEGMKGLLASEKGLAGGLLIIGATVLTALGKMTVSDWQTYTLMVFGVYVAGKTVQGTASVLKNGTKPKE